MSTVLKKRVIAEYSQVQQDETSVKKFKYLLRPVGSSSSGSAFIGLLETKTNYNEVLQLLIRLSEALNFHEGEVPDAVEKLGQRFKIESESVVRSTILSIFADIGSLPDMSKEVIMLIINETINLLQNEESHRVRAQGLTTLLRLGNKFQDNLTLQSKFITQAKKFLVDCSPYVKSKCFKIFGTYLPIDYEIDNCKSSEMMEIIPMYIHANDARVRAAALETMDILHTRGLKLNPSIYLKVCDCLKDDYAKVRIAALKILWLLGTTYPEEMIGSDGDEKLRLVDDAFGRICNCVFDLAVQVRVKAVSLLGTMKSISLHYLEQTLDKKLMSNMRRKRTNKERAQDNLSKGVWGPKQGAISDPPLEVVDLDEISIINQGACGSFAHGLEDEYLEVRSATIDALCELSGADKTFAVQSQEYLVDMFNDEIEEVRLKAIHGLAKISKDIVLREDQLDTVLSVLEDSSMDVREGVHRILTSCQLATNDCLKMTVNELLKSLKKFPQDRKSVWNCFQQMGTLHATLTLPLVPELLAIHPFFDTAEQHVDNPNYVSILLLVFNAAKQHCTMLQLFEEKTIKHYSYLRDTMPNLVPALPLGRKLTSSNLTPPETNTEDFLIRMLKNIETANSSAVRINMLEIVEKDLAKLAHIDSNVTGAAQFLSLYINSQLKLANVLKYKLWYSNATLEHQTSMVKNTIEELLQNVLKMQYIFVGLNNSDIGSIKQFKLKILSLLLVFVVRTTNQSARALCHYYLTQVDDTNKFLNENNIIPDKITYTIVNELSVLEESKPGTVARILLPILQKSTPMLPPKPNVDIKLSYAIINSPVGGPDHQYKFIGGMVMGVQLDADLYNLHNSNCLRIKIKYPDQQTHLLMPRINHLRPVLFESDKNNTHRLVTTALLSHQTWSDMAYVDLSLVLNLTHMENVLSNCVRMTNQLCIIDLCKPIKLAVSPKPIRRGI